MSTDTNNTTINQHINNETNNTPQLNNNELHYEDTYKPWTNVIRGRCTYTANIYDIQRYTEIIDRRKHCTYKQPGCSKCPA